MCRMEVVEVEVRVLKLLCQDVEVGVLKLLCQDVEVETMWKSQNASRHLETSHCILKIVPPMYPQEPRRSLARSLAEDQEEKVDKVLAVVQAHFPALSWFLLYTPRSVAPAAAADRR